MITRVSLKNFKLHASTEIEAAPITVFIGPNNSGKSSIFQALLSLRQAASHGWATLYDPNRYRDPSSLIVDVGDFEDALRSGEREIEVGVMGNLPPSWWTHEKLQVSFRIHVRENRLVYHCGQLEGFIRAINMPASMRDLTVRWDWEWFPSSPAGPYVLEFEGAKLCFFPEHHFRLIRYGGFTEQPPPPEKLTDLQALGQDLGNAPMKLLDSIHPVFPLRGFEEWGYPLPDERAANLDRLSLPDRAVALASLLAYDRDLERKLSEWLHGLLGISVEVKLLPPKRVTIRCKPSFTRDSDSLFLNEGTGANQLPFILIPIGLAPEHETILLCEPEAHLHPKAQTELIRLLLKVAVDRKLQYFIETHSEHVLHSLLHAVAKGDLEREQLAIYHFENVNGEAKVTPLELDETGGVVGGLPGFFEQSLAELVEFLDALKTRNP